MLAPEVKRGHEAVQRVQWLAAVGKAAGDQVGALQIVAAAVGVGRIPVTVEEVGGGGSPTPSFRRRRGLTVWLMSTRVVEGC